VNYLSVDRLEKNLGERILFSDLSFGLSKGDKLALVANNGTGKSSLLKILAGKDEPDAGEVVFRNGIRIGYLAQEPELPEHLTIEQLVRSANTEMLSLIKRYQDAVEQHSLKISSGSEVELNQATAAMDKAQAWDYERRLKEVLTRFGIEDHSLLVQSLSGGQKKRLALALTLLDEPDVLILDEPTNHLDVDMIEWLEEYLKRADFTVFMVTHDRYFLENVCTTILEMHNGQLFTHHGNYSYFLEKRAEREEIKRIEIEKAGKKVKTEIDWIRRMPKARGTKSKARIQKFHETEKVAKSGTKEQDLTLDVKMTRLGGKIMELKKLYKSYGDTVILKGFDYTFKKGERIGIVGANGAGKSTFLNILAGMDQPDSGKINKGDTLVVGYYKQSGLEFKPDMKVIDVLKEHAEVIETSNGSKLTASQFLNHFMFPPKVQHSPVEKLSGGEKRRLHLMTVLIKNPNFLILDEPTNDLDLLTLNKLEDFLLSYGGCLIIVSHDRYFMDTLVDHMLIFRGQGEVKDFNGNYLAYREYLLREENDKKVQEKVVKTKEQEPAKEKVKTKLSFKEKYEFEQLEKDLESLEKEKKEIEEQLNSGKSDYELLRQLGNRLQEVNELLDEKEIRWLELSEYA
jgi:ATP-binding cassette subfamily F protein uup